MTIRASQWRGFGLVGAAALAAACAQPTPRGPIAGAAASGASSAAAGSASPTPDPVESIEPWSFNGAPGRLVRTPHYRVFTTQADTVLNGRLPAFLEGALASYRTFLTGPEAPLPEPPLRLDTYVLRSRTDWALLTRQLTGEHADEFLRIPRGGFAFGGRALLFDIGARDTLSIAAHEGWHQYTQRTFKHRLPVWLEEGIATCMEGHRFDGRGVPTMLPWCNTQRFDQLRKAHAAGRVMSLPTLLEAAPQNLVSAAVEDALTYYAQVWALTLFLMEGEGAKYRPNLESLVRDAALGSMDARIAQVLGRDGIGRTLVTRRGAGIFLAYFGEDVGHAGTGTVADAYARFVARLVQPGSRDAVVAGKSPFLAEPVRVNPMSGGDR